MNQAYQKMKGFRKDNCETMIIFLNPFLVLLPFNF